MLSQNFLQSIFHKTPHELRIHNFENLHIRHDKLLQLTFVLCPLYNQNSLQESELLYNPNSIHSSRVANKWKNITEFLLNIQKDLSEVGVRLRLQAIFANKGVLLKKSPQEEDYQALEQHLVLYRHLLADFCDRNQISYELFDYQSLMVSLPVFIDPLTPIPFWSPHEGSLPLEHQMMKAINLFMESKNSVTVVNNRKNRKTLKYLIKAFELQTAYWLIIGYLIFDQSLPKYVDRGVYLSVERFGAIFNIARFTQPLSDLPRAELIA